MSFPQNPLDKYRSYSTHHILVVAATTETIRVLTTKLSDNQDTQFLNIISNAKLGEPISSGLGNKMDAYLILDSRKLSNYTIKDIEYHTTFSSGNLVNTQIITTFVNMTIFDTYGISFINYLKHLCDEVFKTDYNGLTFLLKTIFVGHTDSGTIETITSSEIPMFMVNLEMNIDHIGGTYYIQFAPLNGGTKFSFPDIYTAYDLSTISGKTLGEMFDSLQNKLNRKIREFYKKLNLENDTKTQSPESVQKNKKIGRPVQYMFTLPGDVIETDKTSSDSKSKWRDFLMTGVLEALEEQDNRIKQEKKKEEEDEERFRQEKLDMQEKLRKNGVPEPEIRTKLDEMNKARIEQKKKNAQNQHNIISVDKYGTVYLALSPKATIPEIISNIMSMCLEVNHKMSYGALKGKKVSRYKTLTYVTSDNESITVHFDIVEQVIVDVDELSTSKKKASSSNNKQSSLSAFFNEDGTPKNSIEFDYIFTGKNTDILNLDIKVNNAVLYLKNVDKLSEDSRQQKDIGNTDQKSKINENIKIDEKQLNYKILENTPITTATKTQLELTAHAAIQQGNSEKLGVENTVLSRARQEALNLMSDLHGVSSQDIKMTIRGNPDLLNKSLSYSQVLPHVKVNDINVIEINEKNTFNVGDETLYKQALKKELEITKTSPSLPEMNVALCPLFCKININTPNVDMYGRPIDDNFAKRYWYDGWYYVSDIYHTFKDGVFTQELTMNAIDIFSRYRSFRNSGE
jgi:hypothetical protein